jgi:hypothetical protein
MTHEPMKYKNKGFCILSRVMLSVVAYETISCDLQFISDGVLWNFCSILCVLMC